MAFELSPGLRAKLTQQLEPKLDKAAEAGAEAYREEIKRGPRSGEHYPGQPARSSAPNEPIQEQEGDHRAAVDWRPTNDPLVKQFGALGVQGMSDRDLAALEFGSADGTLEGRFSLTNVAERPETHQKMREAAKK